MKKHVLFFATVLGTICTATSQVTMTKTLPPFGTRYILGQSASTTLVQPTLGINQVWDYSGTAISSLYTYTITNPTSVKQEYQDSCPTAKYVEVLAIPGAPSPDLNPMQFFTDEGDNIVMVGEKGSGSSLNKTHDTLFKFNQAYQTTEMYRNASMYYAGSGSVKFKSVTYTDVALIIQTRAGSTDTTYAFYQFTPHFHRLAILGWRDGASAQLTIWEPTTSTGVKESLALNAKVYPVPANNFLTIDLNEKPKSGTVVISTILGTEVLQSNIESVSNNIDIQSLNTGIYFVTITVDGKTSTQKFVKN
ncbi:MAG: T9SS type A sorting domain-containing protein [Bacteroidia bacterium]|nr:T9SS type A sorting domain-containing protein [Bacteroidia bacterium]MBP9690203.1 T9SS type A sorting domain-containing protein [Bacteroidia bacterium]